MDVESIKYHIGVLETYIDDIVAQHQSSPFMRGDMGVLLGNLVNLHNLKDIKVKEAARKLSEPRCSCGASRERHYGYDPIMHAYDPVED